MKKVIEENVILEKENKDLRQNIADLIVKVNYILLALRPK